MQPDGSHTGEGAWNEPISDTTPVTGDAVYVYTFSTAITTHSLIYDANGGDADSVPTDDGIYVSGAVVDLDTETTPTHADVKGEAVVFLGWSSKPVSEIVSAGEAYNDALTDSVTFAESDCRVYAVWGYDTNDDGIADASQVMIEHAAITIYTGGSGYEGTVASSDGTLLSDSSSGLPEPGFYFTLPYEMNEAIKNASGGDVTDLSQYLSISAKAHAETGTSTDRNWTITLYDVDGNSAVDGRYLYRFEGAEGQDPVRMQFTDAEGRIVTSDAFDVSTALSQTYTMSLYTGAVDAGSVTAEVTGTGEETTTPVQTTLTGEETTITAVQDDEAPTYLINDSEIAVSDPDSVALLVDEVIDTNGSNAAETLLALAEDVIGDPDGYEIKYLDLVDTANGNAWVTLAEGDSLTVFWPYPEGTDADDDFTLVHYKGLDRDFASDADVSTQLEGLDVLSSDDGTITRTEKGMLFEISDFSPFALTWEKASSSSGGSGGSSGGSGGGSDDDSDLPEDLNTEDHYAYVVGYEDGLVKPENATTRAEVASIFYRLLDEEVREAYDTTENSFSDVAQDSWYVETVSTLASMGIIEGYEDGTFRPVAAITRAEFAAIATRFFEETGATYESGTFTDVFGDEWYAGAIQDAVDHGILGGYEDGSVRPNNSITRAEDCAIVNRTLGRVQDAAHLLSAEEMKTWPDNPEDAWYYADIQEATNSHDYEWITEDGETVEQWTGLFSCHRHKAGAE